jgi:hypothetical protein
MSDSRHTAALKFDQTRATEYEEQGAGNPAQVFIAGAGGTAQEIVTLGSGAAVELHWGRPVCVHLALARSRTELAGLSSRSALSSVIWTISPLNPVSTQPH